MRFWVKLIWTGMLKLTLENFFRYFVLIIWSLYVNQYWFFYFVSCFFFFFFEYWAIHSQFLVTSHVFRLFCTGNTAWKQSFQKLFHLFLIKVMYFSYKFCLEFSKTLPLVIHFSVFRHQSYLGAHSPVWHFTLLSHQPLILVLILEASI